MQTPTSFLLLVSILFPIYTHGAHVRKGVERTDDDFGPTIVNIHSPYLVVGNNSTISITCEGYHSIYWETTVDLSSDGRAFIHERRLYKGHKSTITIIESNYKDTGKFSCYYANNDTVSESRISSVYVFVTDPDHLLVPPDIDNINVATATLVILHQGRKGEIPCKPTHPAINMTLIKFPSDTQAVHLQQGDIEFDPKRGFLIQFPNVFFSGLFECVARLGRITEKMEFHLVWIKNENPPRPYIESSYKKSNGSFVMSCNINAEQEQNINMNWTYPNFENPTLKISPIERTEILSANGYSFLNLKSTLTVSHTNSTDGGRYSCFSFGKNGEFEEDFVYLPIENTARIVKSNLNGSKIESQLDDEIKLLCVVDGFPKPVIQWYKNGQKIDETSDARYRFSKHYFKLVIDEVQYSDAGSYSCVTFNRLGRASRNVTVVVVDSSSIEESMPSIEESRSSVQESTSSIHLGQETSTPNVFSKSPNIQTFSLLLISALILNLILFKFNFV